MEFFPGQLTSGGTAVNGIPTTNYEGTGMPALEAKQLVQRVSRHTVGGDTVNRNDLITFNWNDTA